MRRELGEEAESSRRWDGEREIREPRMRTKIREAGQKGWNNIEGRGKSGKGEMAGVKPN